MQCSIVLEDNAKSGMCVPFKRARGELFSPKKHGFSGLTPCPVYSETTAKQALLYLSSEV